MKINRADYPVYELRNDTCSYCPGYSPVKMLLSPMKHRIGSNPFDEPMVFNAVCEKCGQKYRKVNANAEK